MKIRGETPLQTVVFEHYLPENLRVSSECTIRHYRITVNQFSEFLTRHALVSDLNDNTAIRFARWLLSRDRAPQTVNQRLHYLAAVWRWCAKRRYVAQWPTFQKLTAPKQIPRAWSIDQLAKLLEACRATPGYIGCIPASEWWLNIHRFAWETGERIGAMFKARWCDVDIDRGIVEIPAQYRKGKYQGMIYTISPQLTADLVSMRPGDEPLLFPFPRSLSHFYGLYKEILERAGLPADRRSKMHRMRRSFASHLEAAGGNATDAMKHSSRQMTSDSYLDETIIQRTPAHKLLPDLGKRKGDAA